MRKPKKPTVPPQIQIDKRQGQISKEEEKRLLFASTDELADSKFLDKALDKANEAFSLTEYKQHNPNTPHVAGRVKAYAKKFPIEFYNLIYNLNGWPVTETSLQERPGIVGKWTNDMVYLRFPKGTLSVLQSLNPFIADGVRLYKHFQLLTDPGEELLEQFIDDAMALMRQSFNWKHFVAQFARKYGPTYQSDFLGELK
jgi:hypothetical protein